MQEKERIVLKAFQGEENIQTKAEKLNIQPTIIRQWRKRMGKLKRTLSSKKWDFIKSKKQYGAGGKALNIDVFAQLREYFDKLCENHRVDSVLMLCTKYKLLAGCEEISNKIIQYRIYKWLNREGVVGRRITHHAQNTRHSLRQINDFVQYVNDQVQRLGIPRSNVVNADETSVDVSMDSTRTLNVRGQRTISVRQVKST